MGKWAVVWRTKKSFITFPVGVNFPDVYRRCCNIFKQRGFSYEIFRGRTQWCEITSVLVEGGKETFPFSPQLLVAQSHTFWGNWIKVLSVTDYITTNHISSIPAEPVGNSMALPICSILFLPQKTLALATASLFLIPNHLQTIQMGGFEDGSARY